MAIIDHNSRGRLARDLSISFLIYSLPVVAIFLYFKFTNGVITESHLALPSFLEFTKPAFENIRTWGLTAFMLVLGAIEFTAGLYDDEWTGEERKIDIVFFLAPKLRLEKNLPKTEPMKASWPNLGLNKVMLLS